MKGLTFMKSLMALVILLSLSPLAFAKIYTCSLVEGGAPRYGVTKLKIDFSNEIDRTSRFLLSIIESKYNSESLIYKDVKVLYAHSSNVHNGEYKNYKKFTPSIRTTIPQFFKEKLKEIVLQEKSDRRSARLALIGTRNAKYDCQ